APPPPGFEERAESADGLAEWLAPKPLFNGKLEGAFPELDRNEDEIVVHLPAGNADSPLWISESWHRRWRVTERGNARLLDGGAGWMCLLPGTPGARVLHLHCRAAAPWWSWLACAAGVALALRVGRSKLPAPMPRRTRK